MFANVCFGRKIWLAFLVVALNAVVVVSSALALPWDIDMYRQETLKSNEVARAPVPGTVPVGRIPFTMTMEEAEKALTNPVSADFNSVWRGQRLFNANCSTCHGVTGLGDGPTSQLLVGIPNLLQDLYKQRTDGRVFGVIHYGQNAMPRYGFKFSTAEKWDLVNYVRFLQGRDVQGVPRPQVK